MSKKEDAIEVTTSDFSTRDLQTQEALIREVWGHVDSATKQALATKFAQRLFEAAEKSPVLEDEAREIIARITREVTVPQEIRDSVEGRVRDQLNGVIASEVERTVRAIAQEVTGEIRTRVRGFK